jgi:hypothetical protein
MKIQPELYCDYDSFYSSRKSKQNSQFGFELNHWSGLLPLIAEMCWRFALREMHWYGAMLVLSARAHLVTGECQGNDMLKSKKWGMQVVFIITFLVRNFVDLIHF